MARGNYWQVSFRSSESLSSHARHAGPAGTLPAVAEEGQRRCARDAWCASSVIVTDNDGTRREPALTFQAFCARDRENIARSLGEIPDLHARLRGELGEKGTASGEKVSMSRSAPLPLNASVDALMRSITEALYSWHERVADVARLSFPGADLSRRRRDDVGIEAAVTALGGHLDALLALPPGPMWRTGLEGRELEDLGGAGAGLEILHLHYLCRAVLGETRAKPEELIGVPCRECELLALRRAPLPVSDEDTAWWSECRSCGDRMDEEEYREWTRRYAAWAHRARTVPVLENLPTAG